MLNITSVSSGSIFSAGKMVYEAAETLGEEGGGAGAAGAAGGGLVAGAAPGVGAGVTANATLPASNSNATDLAKYLIMLRVFGQDAQQLV